MKPIFCTSLLILTTWKKGKVTRKDNENHILLCMYMLPILSDFFG